METVVKLKEIHDPNSCLNRASNDEIIFVLRAKDPVAPTIIRFWCHMRILKNRNVYNDAQIREAFACATDMEEQYMQGKF
jgi:hypothetical protein